MMSLIVFIIWKQIFLSWVQYVFDDTCAKRGLEERSVSYNGELLFIFKSQTDARKIDENFDFCHRWRNGPCFQTLSRLQATAEIIFLQKIQRVQNRETQLLLSPYVGSRGQDTEFLLQLERKARVDILAKSAPSTRQGGNK